MALSRRGVKGNALSMLIDYYNQVGIRLRVFNKMASFIEGDLALLVQKGVFLPNKGLSASWPDRPYGGIKKIFVASDSTLNLGSKSTK